ncbi:hypothetical protein PUN28_010489 [Cardiocondyla obscurior]|uniref:Uncharacterized protein n=1 Tax=Cardiocondyla obscurior TaxID=286306 RepID=A0AAW2FJM2_9HYME
MSALFFLFLPYIGAQQPCNDSVFLCHYFCRKQFLTALLVRLYLVIIIIFLQFFFLYNIYLFSYKNSTTAKVNIHLESNAENV